MPRAPAQPVPSSGPSVESVLVPIHNRWLNEIRRFVEPATAPGAGFWDRWAATRYFADQFRDHFRLERALLVALAGLMRPDDAERLATQAGELERVLSDLDRVGRRRGTGPAVAEEARRLMDEIAMWCAELELATSSLRRDALPAHAASALEHVAASGAVNSS
jgi:hypothetical protein